jgi:subtilisin family serine protease
MTSVITTPVFPGDLDPLDYNSHGTLSAGFIATNGIGVASVAPDARLCSIKVLRVTGAGSFGDIIAGLVLATQSGAGVINMSLGLYIDKRIAGVEGLRSAFARAVAFARDKGVVVVASAGNEGANFNEDGEMIAVPAQVKGVISVGATAPFNQQNFDMLASYSNFGSSGVDLFAPGGDFLPGGNQLDLVLGPCSHFQLTLPFECSTSDYVLAAGTSEAAPHVSAAAAVVESQLPGPVKSTQIEECILGNTDIIGPAKVFGAGRLNVLKAAGCGQI